MSITAFPRPGLLASPPTALVIEPVLAHLLALLSTLSSLGFDIRVAETFGEAKTALSRGPAPALLLTDIRLREYNGLHLVLRGKFQYPHLAAIVTSEIFDRVLQRESGLAGATYMVMPTSNQEISAAIRRTLLQPRAAGVAIAPICRPFERRRAERRAGQPATPGMAERRVADRRHDVREARRVVP